MHLVGCARASTFAPGCSYAVSLVMSQSLDMSPHCSVAGGGGDHQACLSSLFRVGVHDAGNMWASTLAQPCLSTSHCQTCINSRCE
jgi:hypothetical protein